MKRIIFILSIFVLLCSTLIAQPQPPAAIGDFVFEGDLGFTITATLEAMSIPFEGCTQVSRRRWCSHQRHSKPSIT